MPLLACHRSPEPPPRRPPSSQPSSPLTIGAPPERERSRPRPSWPKLLRLQHRGSRATLFLTSHHALVGDHEGTSSPLRSVAAPSLSPGNAGSIHPRLLLAPPLLRVSHSCPRPRPQGIERGPRRPDLLPLPSAAGNRDLRLGSVGFVMFWVFPASSCVALAGERANSAVVVLLRADKDASPEGALLCFSFARIAPSPVPLLP